MPFRQLPRSVAELQQALTNAKTKSDNTSGPLQAFSAGTKTTLNTFLPTYNTEIGEMNGALVQQVNASLAEDLSLAVNRMFISHFFQVFNLGVERGIFAAGDRVFYGLDANQTEIPSLGQESEIIFWSGKIATGDADRMAASATAVPMVNPTPAEVAAVHVDFLTKHSDQSTKKDTFDTEQEDVAALFDDALALVEDIWDEVEFTYRHEDPPSKRRKAREWGVVYETRPGEPEDPPA
jgi:hypothetical protein